MKVLVIIPARGGSKGVPKKNIKMLGDKPLIAHAIECAKNSKKVNRIIVTTDSVEIAEVSQQFGSEVILRPNELADDSSNVITAVEHVLEQINEDYDIIVLVQPTSPLRTGNDLDSIINIFSENQNVNGVISVVPMDDMHPARMYNLGIHNELLPFIEYGETSRRQDLKPVYYRNGCFYAVKTKAFFEQKSFMVTNKTAYVMDANWLANIDTQRDFKITELLYQDWKNESFNH